MAQGNGFIPSEAAREAGDYFNALPIDERAKLAPLLEHYRQMGLAEAGATLAGASRHVNARIENIRTTDDRALTAAV